jgi:hypothetical protein
LLGLYRAMSGTFSPVEIVLTVIIALAALGAILQFFRIGGGALGWGLLTFAVVAALQVIMLWVSFQPLFAHDAAFMAALRPQ